jgi:hypothetical protein
MGDPHRAARLMADVVVSRVGEARYSYDWMSKPDWPSFGGDFDDVLCLDDLEKFRRAPEDIYIRFHYRRWFNLDWTRRFNLDRHRRESASR